MLERIEKTGKLGWKSRGELFQRLIRANNALAGIRTIYGDKIDAKVSGENLIITQIDYSADIEQLESDVAQLESDLADIQEVLQGQLPDQTSQGTFGARTASATHIYDGAPTVTAPTTYVDQWKFEAWVTDLSSSGARIRMTKTAISRSEPSNPVLSSIKVILPSGATATNASSINTFQGAGSGELDSGDVWRFQYAFEDEENFVGDTDLIETGFIDVFRLTWLKTADTPSGATDFYGVFETVTDGAVYNTSSGAVP